MKALSEFILLDLGLVSYNEALEIQIGLHSDVRDGKLGGALILLEHNPVITVGSGAADFKNVLLTEDALRAHGIELARTDRGGDVTYHGPGQLVGYPIINLRTKGSDVHGFLRLVEDVIISTIADFGLVGHRNGPAGVWVGDKKVCSIGISVRGGVTYHGFALNVCPNLSHFELINPCGLRSEQITSLEHLVKPSPDISLVRKRVAEQFECIFDVRLVKANR